MSLTSYNPRVELVQFFVANSGGYEWRVSERVASDLDHAMTLPSNRIVADVHVGRADAVLMLGLWLLFLISPHLSATYYFFDYAGQFPRHRDVELMGRRKLRGRLNKGREAGVVHRLERPNYVDKPDPPTSTPVNAAVNIQQRLEPPLVAWDGTVLVPTEWRRIRKLKGQIHPQETYRLNPSFVATSMPIILEESGRIQSILIGHHSIELLLEKELDNCLRYVREALEHQHREIMRRYRGSLEEVYGKLAVDRTEALTIYLTFSTVRLRHPRRPTKTSSEAIE